MMKMSINQYKVRDIAPKELTDGMMRRIEIGDAEVRMVEDMYKELTAVVRFEEETSGFEAGVGLRQW